MSTVHQVSKLKRVLAYAGGGLPLLLLLLTLSMSPLRAADNAAPPTPLPKPGPEETAALPAEAAAPELQDLLPRVAELRQQLTTTLEDYEVRDLVAGPVEVGENVGTSVAQLKLSALPAGQTAPLEVSLPALREAEGPWTLPQPAQFRELLEVKRAATQTQPPVVAVPEAPPAADLDPVPAEMAPATLDLTPAPAPAPSETGTPIFDISGPADLESVTKPAPGQLDITGQEPGPSTVTRPADGGVPVVPLDGPVPEPDALEPIPNSGSMKAPPAVDLEKGPTLPGAESN